jgi:kynurenine formamidase
MSEWIDLTVLIDNNYVVYPGDKDIQYNNLKSI